MANKNVEQFIATYGPVAQQVSKEINVDPNVLLGQWGLESRWGQSEMAKKYHNLGGIKDFSGKGLEAKDNKTGSADRYVKFEDPEVFGMYYADQIRRNFPGAVNSGPDVGAFTRGLAAGKNGSYFGVSPDEYQKSLSSFQASIPEDKALPFTPTEQPKGEEGDMSLGNAPPPSPPKPDTSGASPGERFLGGVLGAAAGAASTGAQAFSSARTGMAAKRAAAEETGRIAAQRAAMASAAPGIPGAPAAPGMAAAPAQGGLSVMRQPIPSGGPDAGRLMPGQTGTMPYNYAKAAGLTDIEAGRALDMTKNAGGVHDLTSQRREGLQRIQQMGGGFTENPRYGGLMTPDQSVGGGPRESYAFKQPVAPSPEVPTGQPGGLQRIPKPAPIPTTAPGPSGLQQVTSMFKSMMRPVGTGMAAAAKYIAPPLAGLSAGLDAAEIAHEYEKPSEQRDYTKMALKGAGILGGGLSMFPPSMPLGLGISAAVPALEYARERGMFGDKKQEQAAPAP